MAKHQPEYWWIHGWNDVHVMATPLASKGFVTVKISSDMHPLTEVHIADMDQVDNLIRQLINARDEAKQRKAA